MYSNGTVLYLPRECFQVVSLKVLSSGWIRPKLGSFHRSSLKREARKVFKKPAAPHPLKALKSFRALPCFLIDNYATNLDGEFVAHLE